MSTAHDPPAVDGRAAPPAPGKRDARWLALAVLAGSHLLIVLDATIVNVALNSVRDDLGFAHADLQWVVTAYTLTFGGFLLLGGRLADRLGRRRMFVWGAVVFALGSFLAGLAESQHLLILGRILQGLAGAVLSPAALSLLLAVFTEQRARDRALGVWAVVSAGGNALGLVLGGVLTQMLSWEWIFWISVPVALCAALCGRFVLPERVDAQVRQFDIAGAILGTVGLGALMYTLVSAPETGWTSPGTWLVLLVATGLLAVFAHLQRTRSNALLPLRVLRDRSVLGADLVGLLFGAAVYALFYFLSVFMGEVLGYTPVEIGLAILPITAAITVAAWCADKLVRRVPPQVMIMTGTSLAAVGLVSLTRIAPGSGYADTLLPGLVCVGLGMGTAFVALTSAAVGEVAEEDSGVASGLFNAGQQIGGAIGLAVLTAVSTARTQRLADESGTVTPGDVTGGWSLGFLVAAGMMLLGTAVTALTIREGKRAASKTAPEATG
ncbi:MFS transporter [Streptomyces sp. HK10]|uniref:MFS transporter n=1 Tax=Streptomyces sp. HK10 TaxID=3373255 RepID=UPI00374A97B2